MTNNDMHTYARAVVLGPPLIDVREKYLSFQGDADYATRLVDSLRGAYGHNDMPKMLNDFVFAIEVALQNVGVLDQDFNPTRQIFRVLETAAHALWDAPMDETETQRLMREAGESYAGIFHKGNYYGWGVCDMTGIEGHLVEVEYEEK